LKHVRVVDSVTKILCATGIVAVVTVGLLASGIIPPSGRTYAKGPNLKMTLQSVRAQLELYRLHHNGAYPANIIDGLTKKTDADGTLSDSGPFGPYMQEFPANPLVEDQARAVQVGGNPGDGWFYNTQTGEFRANSPGHKKL
jgi:general secretion pathway protein G